MVASGQLTPALKDQVRERIILGQSSKKLTDEQVGKALSVIEGVNNPALIDKFLKSGGLALLAKLDGLPEAYRDEIVKQIGEGNLYFCGLSKALDEYHASPAGPDRDAKIGGFIEAVKQMRSASAVQKALDSGKGMTGVIQAAGGIVGASGSGWIASTQTVPLGGSLGTQQSHSFNTTTPVNLGQSLSDFFANYPREQRAKVELLAQAVLSFAEAIRREKENQKAEEDSDTTASTYSLGSSETLKDLEQALETILSKYGSFNNALPGIRQFIQTSFRFNTSGENISTSDVLQMLNSWLNLFDSPEGISGEASPPLTTQLLPESPSPQPPTAQPPAPSPGAFGPPDTNSHQA